MHKARITAGLALMLWCAAGAASAQTTPQQPQDVLSPAPKLNLTLEQRHTIREFAKDMKADAADVKAEIGDLIPQGITPRPMPSDVAQKVPQVKSHRFFLTTQEIVIVDPKDNKVADVIKLGTD
jgi:predicted outer membrane protein